MEFTFGIITNGRADDNIVKVVESIRTLCIPTYEIIIVGNTALRPPRHTSHIQIVPFDESVPAWITHKKNLICQRAKYENVVLLHDYVVLAADWYSGFLRFGNSFDVCISKVLNLDGSRFRDYLLFWPYMHSIDNGFESQCLLPYDFKLNSATAKLAYISGAYYVVKKHIAVRYPLDETKHWGEGEDVEFSYRTACAGICIQMNQHSTVSLLKMKDVLPSMHEITDTRLLDRLRSITVEDTEKWKSDPLCFHLFPILHI
jgi:hypothetical protein